MSSLTIDTEVHPPKILLIPGRAELDFVDGIPDEYLQATSAYEMTPKQRVEWEAEVRSRTTTARSGSSLLDTYSHLWPDSDDRTRTAVDDVLGASVHSVGTTARGAG